MTSDFQHRLEAGLRDLAGETAPPAADLQDRVRSGISRQRRRRRRRGGVLLGSTALACVGLALPFLLNPVHKAPPGPVPGIAPATATPATPSADASTTTDSWWPVAATRLSPASAAVVPKYLDAFGGGPYADIRLLDTIPVPKGDYLVVAGQRGDGKTVVALLAETVKTGMSSPSDTMAVMSELLVPSPSTPVALAVGRAGSTDRAMTVFTPCATRPVMTSNGAVLSFVPDDGGGLALHAPVPFDGIVTVHCDATVFQIGPGDPKEGDVIGPTSLLAGH